jgi:hypothetical protein
MSTYTYATTRTAPVEPRSLVLAIASLWMAFMAPAAFFLASGVGFFPVSSVAGSVSALAGSLVCSVLVVRRPDSFSGQRVALTGGIIAGMLLTLITALISIGVTESYFPG